MELPHIETDRLRLRPVYDIDLDALHALWTNEHVRKYLWDDKVITRDQAREQLDLSRTSFAEHGFGHWAISHTGDDDLIGFAGLRHFDDPPEVEVLYGFCPDHWGKGLATEATMAVLRYGFEERQLERIYGGADPPNKRSFAVMERVGMQFEKRMRIGGVETIYHVVSRADFASEGALYRVTSGAFRGS